MKTTIRSLAAAVVLVAGSHSPAEEEEIPKGLADLKFRYDVEVARVLDPVQRNYLKALRELQKSYEKEGDLDAVVKVREEIARARLWETLPIETMRRQNLSEMNQDDFGAWLRGRQLDFSAKTGRTTMTFDGEQAIWKRAGRTFKGSYTLTSDRRVTIQSNASSVFKIVFDEDLQGGTLESALGKYDLKISDRK